MRLNQFSAWTFGFKYVDLFVYMTPERAPEFQSLLFTGMGDTSPTAEFYQMAETNRQSRNLGPALVRLLSTDLRMIMGRNSSGVVNSTPTGVTAGLTGADPYLTGITVTNNGSKNNGQPGDVIVGFLKPLHETFDGSNYTNEKYFMITNGLSDSAGSAVETRQTLHITFNFGSSGINSLQRLSRNTGLVEVVPLVSDGGSLYHLDLVLDGGTGDLFKYNTGAVFVGIQPVVADNFILVVTPETKNVASPAGTTTFSVANSGTGQMAWTAEVISGSWLTISNGASGNNSGTITASFSANTDPNNPRTGTIRITAVGASGSPKDVTVVQTKALLPGDANKDGRVNFSDYLLLSQNFGKTNTIWDQGNFNTDNITNFSDYLLLSQNFGKGGAVSEAEVAQFKAASESLVAEEESQGIQQTLPCSALGLAVLSVVGLALYSLSSLREQE
jgi:hypothetical protein